MWARLGEIFNTYSHTLLLLIIELLFFDHDLDRLKSRWVVGASLKEGCGESIVGIARLIAGCASR